MKKINLKSFENDSMALKHQLEVRGGSGYFTCSAIIMTICGANDADTDSTDHDMGF
jgi:hypothetical protein